MTAIPLRLIVPPPPVDYRPLLEDGTLQPGDCWSDYPDVNGYAVVLPNGNVWHSWEPARDGISWSVFGVAPKLTAYPLIHDSAPGNEWQGWLRDGELVSS